MSLNIRLDDQELKTLVKAINLVEDCLAEEPHDFSEEELDSLAMLRDSFDSAVEDWD